MNMENDGFIVIEGIHKNPNNIDTIDEKTKKIIFSHNPFSMPQGDIKKLDLSKPLEIKAYQYDIVCNGVELSS